MKTITTKLMVESLETVKREHTLDRMKKTL